ncbi:MAG: EscU/YscU/HrcU family type III secretion system export apparatus switch protein [Desulfurella sp.]|uniref:Flagellar biosynthesis protein n=1 Tax=Desulfurella multipotens TaxID=79269 RepID=A0A1G6J7W5_9BACT|nr:MULTISPECIES: EscU/YscU/HrcU family type III secretion system export apparatus switch protein [Desulfurella]SDC14972.1 flagellar biosynthesis protein [Desulfurella multipotens]
MSSKNDEPKKAVALKYVKEKDKAPKVIAKGKGYLAFIIEETAKKHNVYIKKEPALTQELYKLNIDSQIPEELYEAVAKILSFIYKLKKL